MIGSLIASSRVAADRFAERARCGLHNCLDATERLIRREPTKALLTAAALGIAGQVAWRFVQPGRLTHRTGWR